MRYIGLDVGDRRIGIALSDETGMIAGALETYHRKQLQMDIDYIANVCRTHAVQEIVCGLPLHLDGREGEQAQKTRSFMNYLSTVIDLPAHFVDERGTTKRAQGVLLEANMRRNRRKQNIDKLAAVIILQDFLDRTYKPIQ